MIKDYDIFVNAPNVGKLLPSELVSPPCNNRRSFITKAGALSLVKPAGILGIVGLGAQSANAVDVYSQLSFFGSTVKASGYVNIRGEKYEIGYNELTNLAGNKIWGLVVCYHSKFGTATDSGNNTRAILLSADLSDASFIDTLTSSQAGNLQYIKSRQRLYDSKTSDYKQFAGELRRRKLEGTSFNIPPGASDITTHTIAKEDIKDLIFYGKSYFLNGVYYLTYTYHRLKSDGTFWHAPISTVRGADRKDILTAFQTFKSKARSHRLSYGYEVTGAVCTGAGLVAGLVANSLVDEDKASYWVLIAGIAAAVVAGISVTKLMNLDGEALAEAGFALLRVCELYLDGSPV